jgi:molybdopterin synthase sulfur carrier subunit
MATVRMKLPLGLTYPEGQKEVECHGDTVAEAIADVIAREPRLQSRIYKEDGKLFVGIFLNQQNVRMLQGMETELSDGDELRIMPPIAGG